MKKVLFTLWLAVTGVAASAEDFQYLTVKTNEAEQSITLATIQKITFDTKANNVVVTTSEGTVTFPIEEMQKMFFASTPSAIKQLPLQSEALRVRNGNLEVQGRGFVYIYSSNGTLMQAAKVEDGASISLSNLPKGVYIINKEGQTIKVNR